MPNADTRRSVTTAVEKTPLVQPLRVSRARTPISIQLPGGVRLEVPAKIQLFYDIEDRAKTLSAEERLALRQAEAVPVWKSLGEPETGLMTPSSQMGRPTVGLQDQVEWRETGEAGLADVGLVPRPTLLDSLKNAKPLDAKQLKGGSLG